MLFLILVKASVGNRMRGRYSKEVDLVCPQNCIMMSVDDFT